MNEENNRNIETTRLFLRPFTPSDLDELFALNSDEETMRYISPPLSKDRVARVIDWFISEWKRLGYGWFAIFNQENGDWAVRVKG
jgi:RimJ/RimL family protein N-acetyltransferase